MRVERQAPWYGERQGNGVNLPFATSIPLPITHSTLRIVSREGGDWRSASLRDRERRGMGNWQYAEAPQMAGQKVLFSMLFCEASGYSEPLHSWLNLKAFDLRIQAEGATD
jgi:hypothetical protein